MKKNEYFEHLTAKLVEEISTNPTGWTKSWQTVGAGLPVNAETGRRYRGTNVPWLLWEATTSGYTSNAWATYKAWQRIGAQVQKRTEVGPGTTAIFWKPKTIKVEGEDGKPVLGENGKPKTKRIWIFRSYTVFNLDQVLPIDAEKGIRLHAAAQPVERPELTTGNVSAEIEEFYSATGAVIGYADHFSPCYIPSQDRIEMPSANLFEDLEAHYATLGHEVTHWTGAKARLGRDHSGRFGSYAYAIEELTAEIGAAFLNAHLGLSTSPRPDHAKYLAHWLKVAQEDDGAIYRAAADAVKAVEFVVDLVEAADVEQVEQVRNCSAIRWAA